MHELAAGELPLDGGRQRLVDGGHVDEARGAGEVLRQDLRHQHGDELGVLLERRVRVPVAAGAGDADLLAVLLDVGGDEDQRKIWVVVVVLQVGNRIADALGEVAVLGFGEALVLEDDDAVLVEEVAQLLDLGFRRLGGVDAGHAATDIER